MYFSCVILLENKFWIMLYMLCIMFKTNPGIRRMCKKLHDIISGSLLRMQGTLIIAWLFDNGRDKYIQVLSALIYIKSKQDTKPYFSKLNTGIFNDKIRLSSSIMNNWSVLGAEFNLHWLLQVILYIFVIYTHRDIHYTFAWSLKNPTYFNEKSEVFGITISLNQQTDLRLVCPADCLYPP